MENIAILLTAEKFQEVLDPWSYRAVHTSERWQQCRTAAAVALKGLLNLSWDEISSLKRADCMPDGAPIVRIHDANDRLDREIPVVDAARIVLNRYLDEMPFKDSRYMFVAKSGKRMLQQTLGMSVKKAGLRMGVADLTGSLMATFFHAVMADPVNEVAARVLLGKGCTATEKPSLAQLRACIEHHPAAPFGRIAFYDRLTPNSALRTKILSCETVRNLSEAERFALKTKHFPDAFELWKSGALTSTEIGRFFGASSEEAYRWIYIYKKIGRASFRLPAQGRFTQEWRRKIIAEYELLAPVESFKSFFHHLVDKFDFPYGNSALRKFLNECGEKSPPPPIMTRDWCKLVEREHENGGKTLSSWRAFHEHLRTTFDFPYTIDPILKLARRRGLSRPRLLRDPNWWATKLAEEALLRRPKQIVAFHKEMVGDLGFPRGVNMMRRYLLSKGIVISPNSGTRSKRTGCLLAETGLPLGVVAKAERAAPQAKMPVLSCLGT